MLVRRQLHRRIGHHRSGAGQRLGHLRLDIPPIGELVEARAFERGERFAEPFANAQTIASGIRVPAAVGDFMILDAVRASQGRAVAVSESRIREWMALGMQSEGLAICPETAACIGALETLRDERWIGPTEQVVIFNTGAAQKYPEAMSVNLPRLPSATDIDWEKIAG